MRKARPLLLGALLLCAALPAAASEELDALLGRLSTETAFGRYKIVEQIGDLGTPDAVRALIGFFPDEELRFMAVRQLTQLRGVAVGPLLEAVKSSNADTVRFAAYALGEIRVPDAVPVLLPLLASPDPEIRQNVVFALGMIRDPAAIDGLMTALKDGDPVVRGYAATALGEIGDKRAKEALLAALRKEDSSVVNMATSLHLLGGQEVVGILIDKLRDPNPNNRLYAVYALGKISDPAEITALIGVLDSPEIGWLAAKALVNIGAPAVPSLLETLFAENRDARLYATHALGEIRDTRAGRGILRMLQDPDRLVQDTAAEALVALGDRNLIPAVTQLLQSQDPHVRRLAITVLGKLGDPSLVETVASFLGDADRDVVKSAILALGSLRAVESCPLIGRLLSLPGEDLQDTLRASFLSIGEPAVPCLLGALDGTRGAGLGRAIYLLGKLKATDAVEPLLQRLRDPDPSVRRFAVVALTEIGDPRAEEYLVGLLNDPDPAIRTYASVGLMNFGGRISVKLLLASLNNPDTQWLAVRILDKIGRKDVDELIGALKDEKTRWYAEQALTRLDGNVLPQLEERLKGSDAVLRGNVAQVMGAVKDRRAVAPLLDAIQAEDDSGLASASALIRIGDPAAVEPLVQLLENRSEQVRIYAAYALGGLKDRRAVPALVRSLADPSSSVRGIAAHALGQIGAHDAVSPLVACLDDASPHVRSTAAYALAQLGDRQAAKKLEDRLQGDPDFTVRQAARDALDELQRSGH
jgi:HEAT repeat protein